jgi:hypothetical protein
MAMMLVGFSTAISQTQPHFLVNTKVDAHDAVKGDGVCRTDQGDCSLRAAIEENESNPDWGIITLPADDYVLTLGSLNISTSTSIEGEDHYTTRIDANQKQGFFLQGTSGFNAFFSNLRIVNGMKATQVGGGQGGAIAISSNANVNLFRVDLINNGAEWQGGAIVNTAYLTMSECLVSGNSVPKSNGGGQEGGGGAIMNGGTLILNRTTFANNEGTRGGAIYNSNGANLEMVNCTFSENRVTYQGGAIYNGYNSYKGEPPPVIKAAFCTFTKNEILVPHGPNKQDPPTTSAGGGAIYNNGWLQIGNSIVAANVDPRGISHPNYSPDGWSKDFQGEVIDKTTGAQQTVPIHPIFTLFRGNVLGEVDVSVWNAGDAVWGDLLSDQTGTESSPLLPLLGQLLMNGGNVPTVPPLAGSPALERGTGSTSAAFFECPETDQRGVPRPPHTGGPNGERCDAGAYEAIPTSGELEAEDAELHGAFVIGSDAGASGGAYVSAPNGTGDRTNAPDEGQRIRFQIYVDESGDYNIMGWARGATSNDNSFWVKVDGQPATANLWDLTPVANQFVQHFVSHRGNAMEDNPQFDPVRFTLSKGMHTLDVYLREDGAQLDKVKIMPAPLFAQNLEVESASYLVGAFMVGKDPLASGGKYVSTPTAYSNATALPDGAHKVTTVVTATQAGTYLIRANVQASFDDRNSFWVKVDGLPANGYLWEMTESNSAYGTDYVSHRGNGNSGNPDLDPVELQLAAGPHTIEVFAREGGTRLDRIGLELKQHADMRIVSRGKPATASSQSSSSFAPAKAVDGDAGTSWTSNASDDQWIRLDLQARHQIDRVMLYWNGAYGKEYDIQISEDGTAWTTLYHKSEGTGGADNLMLNGTGRYVKVKGIKRGTSGAYSLKEFDVYGTAVPSGFVCQGACLSAQPLSAYQNAVLNTTGERWYVVTDMVQGWQASEVAGRAISVNGVTLQPGQMPLPSRVNGKYYFRFSAGTYTWASWGFWN